MFCGVVIPVASLPNFNSSDSRAKIQLLLSAFVLLMLLTTTLESASAQHTRPRRVTVSGISTERLSEGDLRRWRTIERFVDARDADNQPVYPTLQGLWGWVERSGHVIYIEIVGSNHTVGCNAGSFDIER